MPIHPVLASEIRVAEMRRDKQLEKARKAVIKRVAKLERDKQRYDRYVVRHAKLTDFRRKYLQWSIYGVGVIPEDQKQLRMLKRVWLPIFDLVAIIAGFRSVYSGIPAIEELLPGWAADGLCYGLVVIGAGCLLGILVPRLYLLEIWFKSALLGAFGSYIIALRILVAEGDDARDFVSFTMIMAMILPLFRLGILAQEKRDREDDK